jgi:hypothetical protein
MTKLFSNKIFCFTGINQKERIDLEAKILEKGGQVSGDLTNHVTHLVCERVGTEKYLAARKLWIEIVLPAYIEDPRDENKCKSLQGQTVSTTGIAGKELQQIILCIKELGGTYRADMTAKTDLLIAASNTSAKALAAQKWNIKVESAKYLDELKAGPVCTIFEDVIVCLEDGFDENLAGYLRKVVRYGGGNLLNTFSSLATHLVTSKSFQTRDLKNKLTQTRNCHVVSHHWLSESFIKNKLLPIEKFIIPSEDSDSSNTSSQPAKIRKLESIDNDSERRPWKLSRLESGKELELDNNTDSNVKSVKPIAGSNHNLFTGKNVFIEYFTREEKGALMNTVVLQGGKVVDQRADNTIIIHPFQRKCADKECYTEFWVEKCIQTCSLLSRDSSIMFKPCQRELPVAGIYF